MWQPKTFQWRLICTLAVLVVLFWPAQGQQGDPDRSLAIKTVNWLADPMHTLPRPPGTLSFDDEDDVAAITAHDAQEAEYERVYASSAIARLRIRARDMQEPFDSSTERQLLSAVVVLGALFIWRLGA